MSKKQKISPENIVFLEVDTEDEKTILKAFPQAKIENTVLTDEQIIKKYPNAEVLCIFIYSPITKKVIYGLKNLKLVVTRSVGYNHIDLRAAQERSIPVCNVPDYGSHVIAEHVFAILLSSIRQIGAGEIRVGQKNFDYHGLRGIALQGKTLGIVGMGKIGKNVARIASLGFLMNVIAYDPNPDESLARESHFEYVSLEKIWRKSDIISFHVPLLKNTKHIVNAKTIKKMKDGVILVNTARGGIIDTKALLNGLISGKIAYAALDVLEHEQNIEKDQNLIHHPRVIITPHIAFYADDSMQKMYAEGIMSIHVFLGQGKLFHQVRGL
ncbi:phosphoglycerate dehydrogenase [Candidatus Peregrinibacteria bacterium]|nr:phosphoglycerate dehydrogenase [Candidatus Peregrinibacteria bacterium]